VKLGFPGPPRLRDWTRLALLLLLVPSLGGVKAQKPNDKVILTVNAVVHASAQKAGSKDSDGELNDELTCQLTETVEYKIVHNDGKGDLSLERISHKNRMNVSGKGLLISKDGGVETWQKWTYSMNPESSSPNSGIAEINSSPPYKVRITVGNFFANCHGKAYGTQKYATGWDSGSNSPTYEITPLETNGFASLAEDWVFESIEDSQLAAKGEMTALAKKLQTTYTPSKDGGFFASGSASHTYEKRNGREIALSGTVEVHYSVQCGQGDRDEVEVTVEADKGFEKWIPVGNLDDPKKPGNKVALNFTVHKKGDPATPKEATLSFSWTKVSKEKGVCMNWPRGNPEEAEGLRFLQDENAELEVPGPQAAHSKGLVSQASLVVSAFDYGGWGILHVKAEDSDGRNVNIKFKGVENPDISLPLDDNHNHIADAWETQWAGGLRGQETADEDAEPIGDGHAGDVLSLYEEYRGFRISGAGEATASGGVPQELITGYHVRTNPRVKDVFVCDTLGLGIGAFRVSGLQVHIVKQEECGTGKAGVFNTHTISPNRGSWSKGEQYVLWMESGNPGTGYAGEAIMKGGDPSVPRDCQKIIVSAPSTGGSKLITADEDTRVTLTHELAHACNVKHHGIVNLVGFVRGEQISDHSVVNESGQISAAVDSVAGGDTHCYMAYQANLYEDKKEGTWWVWDASGNRYTGTKWKENSPRFAKYRFCDGPSTWELGPGGAPSAGLGDCNRQFCVNHLKH